ncbi:hypothetical protein [Terriglobus tenax]|uniref:hypothetical protein n=1 Tax=Terriglobus tenax TaxID=1111115 RepID=UPI0021DFF950|nr:hypothetical protein [Terriglobus tenax]
MFDAEITEIREASRQGRQSVWQIALSQTEFAPGATGVLEATARSGAKLEVPVLEVLKDDAGVIWHVTLKPLLEGTPVVGRVA